MIKVKLTDKEVEVRKPTAKQLSDAQSYAGKLFVKLINEKDDDGNSTAIFKSQLSDHMKKTGLWTDEDDAKLDDIDNQIMQKERDAAETRSKSKAREIAIAIRTLRGEKLLLINKKNQLDLFTVESQVDNAKFDYLVSVCVYNSDGSRVYSSVEDYLEKSNTPEAAKVAMELSKLIYGLNDDFQSKLFENKILKKIGAVDDKFRLVDTEGKLVDADGKRIDEDGFWLNEDGKRVDENGKLVDVDIDAVVYDEE